MLSHAGDFICAVVLVVFVDLNVAELADSGICCVIIIDEHQVVHEPGEECADWNGVMHPVGAGVVEVPAMNKQRLKTTSP